MKRYILEMQWFRLPERAFILDEQGVSIGYITIYSDRNKIKAFFKFLIRFFYKYYSLNIAVYDNGRNLRVQFDPCKVLTLFSAWDGYELKDGQRVPFRLAAERKLKIGWNLELMTEDKEYIIKDQTVGTEPKFYNQEGKMIAKGKDNLMRRILIDLHQEDLDVYLVAGITFLMRVWT